MACRNAVEACLDGEGWDLWHALFEWGEPTVGPIIRQVDTPDPRVQRVTFVVLPLFEITSIDDVQDGLFSGVWNSEPPYMAV